MTQKVSNSAVKKFKVLPNVQVSTKDKMHFSASSQFFWTKPNQSKYTRDNVNNLERFFFHFFLNDKFKKSI